MNFAKRKRILFLLLIGSFWLFLGCAATHPRTIPDLAETMPAMRKILVLVPEIDARLKYIGTRHHISNKENTEKVYSYFLTGYHNRLEELGYEFYAEHINLPEDVENSQEMRHFHAKLRYLAEKIIQDDPEYYQEELQGEFSPKLRSSIPKALHKFDAVILCYGSAKIETDREYRHRWTKNLFYNIALLPLIFAAYVLPFALPFTISASNLAFELSPDECFLNMVICDLHSKQIVYQNDYSSGAIIGFHEDEFHSIANKLLEALPSRKKDP